MCLKHRMTRMYRFSTYKVLTKFITSHTTDVEVETYTNTSKKSG